MLSYFSPRGRFTKEIWLKQRQLSKSGIANANGYCQVKHKLESILEMNAVATKKSWRISMIPLAGKSATDV